MLRPLFVALSLLAAPAVTALPLHAAGAEEPVAKGVRLIMVDLERCGFCRAWKRDVLPHYDTRAEGRAAPIAVVPIDGPWPEGIVLASRPFVTPTFILVRDGYEEARFEGYPGPDAFWSTLREALSLTGVLPEGRG